MAVAARGIAARVIAAAREHEITDWAASLTYYGLLAVFPALIALVSILGLVGQSATDPILSNLETLAPGPARDILTGAVQQVDSAPAVGLGLVIGLGGALWSASGYLGAFSRAMQAINGTAEERPFWKLRPLQFAIATAMVVLLGLAGIAVVVTGPVAHRVGDIVGAGGTAVQVWDIAKWPVIAIVALTMISILYRTAPGERPSALLWITPGSLLAFTGWVLASLGFALFLATFGSYNATYGTLAGVVVFLVWLWITNVAILAGAELDAALEHDADFPPAAIEEPPLG